MKILSVKQFSNKLKATVQASGRLNFTDDTTKTLGINENTFVKFALDDANDDALYLALAANNDEDAFRVRKSGAYYYVPTKNLFDALEINYIDKTICYDLIRAQSKDEELDGMAFRMNERETKNRNGGDDDLNE